MPTRCAAPATGSAARTAATPATAIGIGGGTPAPIALLVTADRVVDHDGIPRFFGISLMASTTLLAPDWWHALGGADDAALIADQQAGGGIAWAAGDLPAFLLVVALLVSWFH